DPRWGRRGSALSGRGTTGVSPAVAVACGSGPGDPGLGDGGNRILLTSRPYGLDDAAARRITLDQAPVADLGDETQALLARRWFHVLVQDRATAEATAAEMLEHVRDREWLEPLPRQPRRLSPTWIVASERGRRPPGT